jgi:hypothetical protein
MKEQFVWYREEVYDKAVGRPIFVYQNKDMVADKHPKQEKLWSAIKPLTGLNSIPIKRL